MSAFIARPKIIAPVLALRLNFFEINRAVTAPEFWAMCRAYKEICYEAEYCGRFAEGCYCHDHIFRQQREATLK